MKAISLWQPYASLIAFGSKPYETRRWSPPDSLIGERIAIHAAKKKIPNYEYNAYCYYEDDDRHGVSYEFQTQFKISFDVDWRKLLPYGSVVATAKLNAVYKVFYKHTNHCNNVVSCSVNYRKSNGELMHMKHIPVEYDEFGDYSVGRYLWELTDIVTMDEPIPAIGRQGFWNWNGNQQKTIK